MRLRSIPVALCALLAGCIEFTEQRFCRENPKAVVCSGAKEPLALTAISPGFIPRTGRVIVHGANFTPDTVFSINDVALLPTNVRLIDERAVELTLASAASGDIAKVSAKDKVTTAVLDRLPVSPWRLARELAGGNVGRISAGPKYAFALASDTQTVFRTSEDGSEWLPVPTDLPSTGRRHFRVIADRRNPEGLFLASGPPFLRNGEVSLWHSGDLGRTWTLRSDTGLHLDLGGAVLLEQHPHQPEVLFVGNGTATLRSADAGGSWTALTGGAFYDLAFDAEHVCGVGDKIRVSTDGGVTFKDVPIGGGLDGPIGGFIGVAATASSAVFVAINETTMVRSIQGCTAFEQVAFAPPTSLYRAVGFDSQDRLWVASRGVLEVANATSPPPFQVVGAPRGFSGSAIEPDPLRPGHVWISADGYGAGASTGPSSVSLRNKGLTAAPVTAVYRAGQNLYAAVGGVVWSTSNAGETWTQLNGVLSAPPKQLARIPPAGNVVAVMDSALAVYDAGAWASVPTPAGPPPLRSLTFADADHAYVATGDERIYATSTFGTSDPWTPLPQTGLSAVFVDYERTVFAAGPEGIRSGSHAGTGTLLGSVHSTAAVSGAWFNQEVAAAMLVDGTRIRVRTTFGFEDAGSAGSEITAFFGPIDNLYATDSTALYFVDRLKNPPSLPLADRLPDNYSPSAGALDTDAVFLGTNRGLLIHPSGGGTRPSP